MGPPVGGRGMMGPSSIQTNQQAGLPFAGVPGPLQDRVRKVLEDEPDHPDPVVEFSHTMPEHRDLTLRSFLAPHRAKLAIAALLVIIETIAFQAGPLLTQIGIDHGVLAGRYSVVVVATMVYLASILLHALTSRRRINYTGDLGEGLLYELRLRVFSHFQRQSLDFFTGEKAGVLMTRMTSDIEALSVLFQEGLINFGVQALTLLVITGVLFFLNPTLALVAVAVSLPTTVLITLWFRKASDVGYDRVRDRIAAVLSDLSESLAGIRVITAHNRRRHNIIHHRNVVGAHEDANRFTAFASSSFGAAAEGIGIVSQAVILLVGGAMVINGSLTVGELTAFALYLAAFFAPIQQLVQLYNSYQQGQAAITKLRTLLSTAPSVQESETAEDLPPIEGHIRLENVTFGYDPDVPVLHNVSLDVPAGESIAIVGPTGAGKSTIAKLITRFYDPTDGSVSIDGHPLTGVTIESLRRQLGVVPQEPFLFNGSIRDNVAFANPDVDDSEVWAAVRSAGIDDLVESLPAGLDSPCHERGSSLSAGERQLLALARAFLARPRVLVLDEATSNLDLESESKIEVALDALLQGRTAIIIAHRLATAMRADRIAVVDDGGIIELGSHEDLVALGGHYAAMFETWMEHTNT